MHVNGSAYTPNLLLILFGWISFFFLATVAHCSGRNVQRLSFLSVFFYTFWIRAVTWCRFHIFSLSLMQTAYLLTRNTQHTVSVRFSTMLITFRGLLIANFFFFPFRPTLNACHRRRRRLLRGLYVCTLMLVRLQQYRMQM